MDGFTLGRDVILTYNAPEGVIDFDMITGFKADPKVGEINVIGMDGITRHIITHDGWEGEFDIDRSNDTVDSVWAQLEENYHAGMAQGTGIINETIMEEDGAVSQYQYTEVLLKLKNAGDKKGKEVVKQKMGFFAQRRLKIA